MHKIYVCFLWNEGFRDYRPRHVNLWAAALKYWDKGCRTICITDEAEGFSSDVEVFRLPDSARKVTEIPAPQGSNFPSSYRRLWLFSNEANEIGDRIMLLDIDCLILGNPSPLWDIDSDFVGWKPNISWGREDRVAGGTWLVKTGKLNWLWDIFTKNPGQVIKECKAMGWNGSDQAVMSRYLYNRYPIWPQLSGIYSAQDGICEWQMPPKDSRIVHFNGKDKLWDSDMKWVMAYRRFFGDLNDREWPESRKRLATG